MTGMTADLRLFGDVAEGRAEAMPRAPAAGPVLPQDMIVERYLPVADDRLIELFACCPDPGDPFALRDLYLGRVECEADDGNSDDPRARAWRARRRLRDVRQEEVFGSRPAIAFVKELFNAFFRDELYGRFRRDSTLILSSGAVCEETYGLPDIAKSAIRYALDRDWYGYSDSRGREAAREAVAAYESGRCGGAQYGQGQVAITMGATLAISSLADFLLFGKSGVGEALCVVPNYPPLVEAVARRGPCRLVPAESRNGRIDLAPVIAALRPDTPLILLQTANNPTGALVDEASLERLIDALPPSAMLILDECHEFIGAEIARSPKRSTGNVIRVSSLSKTWSVPGMKLGWILADKAVIDAYYEYASTSYGGPPSLFFTLIETITRLERWFEAGLATVGRSEMAEFEAGYGVEPQGLQSAFDAYRTARLARAARLQNARNDFLGSLAGAPFKVMPPAYSINASLFPTETDDSFVLFRNQMASRDISFYPGILNFCFGSGLSRATTSRPEADLMRAAALLSGEEAAPPNAEDGLVAQLV